MKVPMALALNNNNLKTFRNPSLGYYHCGGDQSNDEDFEIDNCDEYSSLLISPAVNSQISKEESLLIELTTNFNNNKPVLGKFPKSSSFDSSTTLTSQQALQSPNAKKNYAKQKTKQINYFKQEKISSPPNESHVTCRNESESDNEYTLMLGSNYVSSLNGISDESSDISNLQKNFSSHSLLNGTAPLLNTASGTNNNNVTLRRSTRSLVRAKTTCFYRIHSFLSRNSYLNLLILIVVVAGLLVAAYLTKDYAKRLFYWVETQNPWTTFGLFIAFFILVSFPIIVGYFALLVTAGYLFGCLKGILTVILGANLGIAIAHITIRSLRHHFPTQKLIKNETARAILRVISGPRAFKVVLFTRLTPIPFGLQNAIFGVSTINNRIYHIATFIGLLPAQTINVYLGSTLRSMQEVLSSNGTSMMGYIGIGFEIICGAALMCWVIQKARKELSETLISDLSDNKDIDIEV